MFTCLRTSRAAVFWIVSSHNRPSYVTTVCQFYNYPQNRRKQSPVAVSLVGWSPEKLYFSFISLIDLFSLRKKVKNLKLKHYYYIQFILRKQVVLSQIAWFVLEYFHFPFYVFKFLRVLRMRYSRGKNQQF